MAHYIVVINDKTCEGWVLLPEVTELLRQLQNNDHVSALSLTLTNDELQYYDTESLFHADFVAFCDAGLKILTADNIEVNGFSSDEGEATKYNESARVTCELRDIRVW